MVNKNGYYHNNARLIESRKTLKFYWSITNVFHNIETENKIQNFITRQFEELIFVAGIFFVKETS